MKLSERKVVLMELGKFMHGHEEVWLTAKRRATAENPWFIPEFIELAVANIVREFLSEEALQFLIDRYDLGDNPTPKRVGIVMAGNIPLVGFHDLLCTFLSGHYAVVKPSSKDDVLIRTLMTKMTAINPAAEPYLTIAEMLKGCDAYIATGSNNTAKHFEHYFAKYAHIIRRNRTSVAILTGEESMAELEALADDVYLFFGLGCRNVTKIYVPKEYDFVPLLNAFRKYNYLADHTKYKNNYDYNLAIHLLNQRPYMSNESLLLVEDASTFSPISQLHYEHYEDVNDVLMALKENEVIQCIVGDGGLPFGRSQKPAVCDYADGVDTLCFLTSLNEVRSA